MTNKDILVKINNMGQLESLAQNLQKTYSEVINDAIDSAYQLMITHDQEAKERESLNLKVYISKHYSAPENVENFVKTLIISADGSALIQMYEKGTKYDKYMVINSDVIIVIPLIEDGKMYLGPGTKREIDSALHFNRKVFVFDYLNLTFGKIEEIKNNIDSKTHKYTLTTKEIDLIDELSDVVMILERLGRREYGKDDESIIAV